MPNRLEEVINHFEGKTKLTVEDIKYGFLTMSKYFLYEKHLESVVKDTLNTKESAEQQFNVFKNEIEEKIQCIEKMCRRNKKNLDKVHEILEDSVSKEVQEVLNRSVVDVYKKFDQKDVSQVEDKFNQRLLEMEKMIVANCDKKITKSKAQFKEKVVLKVTQWSQSFQKSMFQSNTKLQKKIFDKIKSDIQPRMKEMQAKISELLLNVQKHQNVEKSITDFSFAKDISDSGSNQTEITLSPQAFKQLTIIQKVFPKVWDIIPPKKIVKDQITINDLNQLDAFLELQEVENEGDAARLQGTIRKTFQKIQTRYHKKKKPFFSKDYKHSDNLQNLEMLQLF